MPDREKVIKALEEISDYFFNIYRNDTDSYKCAKALEYSDVAIDTITMLKEQEAVKPVPPEDEFDLYRCGKCYHQLFRCVDKYCSRCGQAVKWE